MNTATDTLLAFVKDNYEREIAKAEKRLLLKIKEAIKTAYDKRVILDGPPAVFARVEGEKNLYVIVMLHIRNGHLRALLRPQEHRFADYGSKPKFNIHHFDKDMEIRLVETEDVKALATKVAETLKIHEEIQQYIDNLPQKAPGSDDIVLTRFLGKEMKNDYTENYLFEQENSQKPYSVSEYMFKENIYPKHLFSALFKVFDKKGAIVDKRLRIVEAYSFNKAFEIAQSACKPGVIGNADEIVICNHVKPLTEETGTIIKEPFLK